MGWNPNCELLPTEAPLGGESRVVSLSFVKANVDYRGELAKR